MKRGDIIDYTLTEDHPAVASGNAGADDTVPMLVVAVDDNGEASGFVFHTDGTTSFARGVTENPPESTPESTPQTQPDATPTQPDTQPQPAQSQSVEFNGGNQ